MKLKSLFLSLGLVICFAPSLKAQTPASLYQIASLLPKDSELVEITRVSSWATQIDNAVLEILNTKTGHVFCRAIPDNDLILKRSFFLLDSSVSSAKKICQDQFAKKWTPTPFTKRYFFILTQEADYKLDGWTTPRNETFIFLHKNEVDIGTRIKRTLIHELAISYDQKEQLGFLGGAVDSSLLGLTPDENTCLLHAIVRRPTMKHTLATLRAFDMEAAISQELGLKLQEGFANWGELTCTEKFTFMSSYITPMSQALAAEGLVSLMLESNACSRFTAGKTDLELAQMLSNISLKFQDGSSQNACNFLSQGLPYWPGLSHHGGPGPRIGGGGWLTLDEIKKQKQGLQAPKREETKSPIKKEIVQKEIVRSKPLEEPHVISEPRP